MASHAQSQDGNLPSSLGEFSTVKSKWVVMQHSNKKPTNNLHDLASVPDFDLLDPGWLDSAPLDGVQGKPSKQGTQFEVIVAQESAQQAGALDGAAKDGELETILNNEADAEAAPPPPAPLFRDDEMESWLLATLDDPGEGTSAQEAAQVEKKPASAPSSQQQPQSRTNKGQPEEVMRHSEDANGTMNSRAASPNLQQLQQQLNAQRVQQRMKLQQHQQNQQQQQMSEGEQALRSQDSREQLQQQQQQQHQHPHQQPKGHGSGPKPNAVSLHQQQQQLLRSQQQRLARQEQEQQQQQQLALLKELQDEEDEMQRQLQERKAQIQEQKLRAEAAAESPGMSEPHAGHAQLLQRQMMQQQQQMQHMEEGRSHQKEHGTSSSGPSSGAAPSSGVAHLNFSHFSRPAHLYSRANLKTMGTSALRGNGPAAPAPSGGAQPAGAAAKPAGPAPKLPPLLAAKYSTSSGAASVAESNKVHGGGHHTAKLPAPKLHEPAKDQDDDFLPPSCQPADLRRQGLATRGSGGQYAPLNAPRPEGKDSGDQAPSTVTETPRVADRRPKVEKETTVCSAPGASILERRPGGSMLSRGAATEMSMRSSGSRFLKRSREETEYTMSETMPEESEDTRKSGRKPGESSMGGPGDSAAKRARAAEVHNLSERRRRDRINERMRMLQELIPNSNKTDKASMLDEAIEYLKMLQLQLQVMSMRSGMSIPANLMPGAGGESAMSMGEDSLPGSLGKLPGMGGLDDGSGMAGCPDLGLAEMAASGFGMPESAAGFAASDLRMGVMDREMASLPGSLSMSGMPQRDLSSLPARQRLLMEMVQADLQEQQQQQQQMLHQHQQQQMLLASKAGTMASLQRSAAARGAGAGLPPGVPAMGVLPKTEIFSRASSLGPQLPAQAHFGSYGALRGQVNPGSAAGMGAGFGMGDGLPGTGSMGAMAAAAIMLEGHRQLNPSAVDPLDVYLARQQRMQQQQLQLQEEQQQQQQQAAVDFQMYQAILKRQNQTMG